MYVLCAHGKLDIVVNTHLKKQYVYGSPRLWCECFVVQFYLDPCPTGSWNIFDTRFEYEYYNILLFSANIQRSDPFTVQIFIMAFHCIIVVTLFLTATLWKLRSCHPFIDYYAQLGVHGRWDCIQHCVSGTRAFLYAFNTCFCILCDEDIKKLTPGFLERFLTAGDCKSLHDLKKGNIEMFKNITVPYHFCRPVKAVYSFH